MTAPIPKNEQERLKRLRAYRLLDTPSEQRFDDLTALAAEICETPIALVTLLDESRQWFKSTYGFEGTETSRDVAFCAHALGGRDLLIVPDALDDERFVDNPLVQGDPHIRSYAGAPLITSSNVVLGTLCVIDRVPRQLSEKQLGALRILSQQVMTQMELGRQANDLAVSENRLLKIFSSCPVALSIHRLSDRKFVEVNTAFSDLLGWANADVVGRTSSELNIVSDETAAMLAHSLGTQTSLRDAEVSVTTRRGELRRVILGTELIELRGEQHAVTTLVDISARKLAEDALITERAVLSAVTDSLAAYTARRDWGEAMKLLLRCALQQTKSESGFIGVWVGQSKIRLLAHEGLVWARMFNHDLKETTTPPHSDTGYLDISDLNHPFGRVLATGLVTISNSPWTDLHNQNGSSDQPCLQNILCVPVSSVDDVHGLVVLANRPGDFSAEDQRSIETLVHHAGSLCTSYLQHLKAIELEKERTKSGEELSESNERFHLVARATTDVVWDWNLTSDRIWWNNSYQSLFGYPLEELPLEAKHRMSLVHPEDRARVERGLEAAVQGTGSSWADEYRFRRKDGTYCEIFDRGSVIRDTAGRAVRMIGAMQDVTDRRHAQLASERLAAIVASSDDAIISKDLNSTITSWNRGAENIFGYKAEEIIGTSILKLIPEDRRNEDVLIIERIRRGESIEHLETVRVTKAGRLIDVSLTTSPIRDANGKIVGVSKITRDITERKRIDARFRRLVDSNAQGVMFWNTNGQISSGNDALWRMLGYSREEVAANPLLWTALTPPEFHDCDRKAMDEMKQTGVCAPYEKKFIKKDGTRLSVLVGAATFEDNPAEGVSFVLDLTERKKLEQQFLRAQRLESVGTLAGGISHDLNNLLAPITMGLGLIKQFTAEPALLPIVETMEVSARRGADLVKQVLSFARGVEGSRTAIHLKHVIAEIKSILLNTFPKNITVETRIAADLRLVMADATQLNQVFLNICVNARDAMPNGGRLTISAQNVKIDETYAVMNRVMAPGQYVAINLVDTGCGIPKEIIDRIFEPFFTTKELGKGTGLGLSTVVGIVRSHGGFINVYSEPDKGSTFKLYLPAVIDTAVLDSHIQREDTLPRGHNELVLIVDDEASILDITKQTLEAFGYRVLTAEDGAQAIGLYATHRDQISVVLTDMMMPVMDGPALIAALRRLNPNVRVIAASGLNANANVTRAYNLGVKQFLEKPYSADTMLKALSTALLPT